MSATTVTHNASPGRPHICKRTLPRMTGRSLTSVSHCTSSLRSERCGVNGVTMTRGLLASTSAAVEQKWVRFNDKAAIRCKQIVQIP